MTSLSITIDNYFAKFEIKDEVEKILTPRQLKYKDENVKRLVKDLGIKNTQTIAGAYLFKFDFYKILQYAYYFFSLGAFGNAVENKKDSDKTMNLHQKYDFLHYTVDKKIESENLGIFIGLNAIKSLFTNVDFWNNSPKTLKFTPLIVTKVKKGKTGDFTSMEIETEKEEGEEIEFKMPEKGDILVENKGRRTENLGISLLYAEHQIRKTNFGVDKDIYQGFATLFMRKPQQKVFNKENGKSDNKTANKYITQLEGNKTYKTPILVIELLNSKKMSGVKKQEN